MIPLMIDSGAYTAWSKGLVVDMPNYINFCHEVLKDHPDAVIVNLDVIGDGQASYENWRIMRGFGLKPLPIYHVITEEKWLKKYLEETDHVGIGAIASMSSGKRKMALDRVFTKYLINPKTRMPTAKAHGMGITSFPLMRRYPWHSLDSTSWLYVAMYGHVCIPRRRGGQWDYSKQPTKIAFSDDSGDGRKRGRHYSNVSPHEKVNLLLYLKEKGFRIGFTVPCVEGGEVALRGVSNWHGDRSDLCTEYFASFLASMPWPRPFLDKSRPKGLGIEFHE